jgi:hypothetical protein
MSIPSSKFLSDHTRFISSPNQSVAALRRSLRTSVQEFHIQIKKKQKDAFTVGGASPPARGAPTRVCRICIPRGLGRPNATPELLRRDRFKCMAKEVRAGQASSTMVTIFKLSIPTESCCPWCGAGQSSRMEAQEIALGTGVLIQPSASL